MGYSNLEALGWVPPVVNVRQALVSQAVCGAVGVAVASALCFHGIPSAKANVEIFQGEPRVVDGDTVVIDKARIRLLGIDAPEMKQVCSNTFGVRYACGVKSKKYLEFLIGGEPLRCESHSKDRYGREVAVCSTLFNVDVNSEMVKQGWAVAYPQYSKKYVPDEEVAKLERKGIWSGSFDRPSEYREDVRSSDKK
mmetsp:Transcript_4760/g.14345  ORF Transcript_4760/g.14345 Transcript_4760/m.14345 type:complete len:195 (+) Transcript_4760:3513-4097(+)